MPGYPHEIDQFTVKESLPFGARIRATRKAAGLTLEQASTASGISRAALSRIERDEMSPTYASLLKIARGLGIDLATLVAGRTPAGGGFEITVSGQGEEYCDGRFTHRLLAPGLPERNLFSFVIEVNATCLEDYDDWDRHDSEDLLYVLDGQVAVHLAGRESLTLGPGDSMQMDGRIGHALVALPGKTGNTPFARLLWVSVPLQ